MKTSDLVRMQIMKPLITLLLASMSLTATQAQTWPTHRKDFGRTGYVNSEVDPGRLQRLWSWKETDALVPPEPAWDGPARWDAYAELKDLPAMRQYDACFYPVSDGKLVLFGSSSQDSVFALDLETGKQKWVFVSGGPIRIAPTIEQDKVLFGSDDGFAYCLNKSDGSLLWKFNPAAASQAEQRRVITNDRLISFYPIRTGIAVRNGIAYFAASFLPWRESYLCGVNLKTGQPDLPESTFVTRHEKATLEGPLLIAENRLIVPQGRIAPLLFDRTSGERLSTLPGGGGVTIVLTENGNMARAEGGSAARPGQVGIFQGKERVASFPRGRSIVVRPNAYYVIDRQKVFAVNRKANELLWQVDSSEPLEIIMVGKYLFVGGRDQISVFDSKTGQLAWQTQVDGRVFGLAFAGSKLVASTDRGNVIAFAAIAPEKWQPKVSKLRATRKLLPVPQQAISKGLLHRWTFHRSQMTGQLNRPVVEDSLKMIKVKDQTGEADLSLAGAATSAAVGESQKVEAVEMEKAMFPIDEAIAKALPDSQISVESWVKVDRPETWGGIVGCIQDDGSTEHGWLLGFNGDRFSFALAGSRSGLTYLKADQAFQKGRWYHVAATYDGKQMKLYLNGTLSASSDEEQGPISYANKRFFTVGAYKDANESYPLKGALHEIRIFQNALTAEEIGGHYRQLKAEFATADSTTQSTAPQFLRWGPYLRYVSPGCAEISYGTIQPVPSVVEIDWGDGRPLSQILESKQKRDHHVTVSNLPTNRLLTYRIKPAVEKQTQETTSAEFQLDTHFDWSVNETDFKVDSALSHLPNPRGMAFVFGENNVEYAMQLASRSNLTVVFFADDEAQAAELRNRWIQSQKIQYGRQLSVSLIRPENLPAAAAQLVVPPRSLAAEHAAPYRRLVRPSGGIMADAERVLWTRGKVAGAGEWTHMYGLPNNSAFGGEELGDASNREDLVANWIGKPGPRYQTDRQNRKPSPLAANGRLFLQGQQRMIALDSYSGSILWSVEAPTVMRWNVPRDSSNWCADKAGVYVAAQSEAWFIDGATGKIMKRFPVPAVATQPLSQDDSIYWGYIARHQQLLIGTAVQSEAIYTKWWGKTQWFDTPTGEDTHLVAGDALFAIDHRSGELKWSYPGLVLHPTITIYANRIYFIEDKTAEHIEGRSRRISLDKNQQHELVALSASDGKEIFRQPLAGFQGKVAALYLAAGGNSKLNSLILTASEATRGEFSVTRFAPEDGKEHWKRSVKWEANHHGKHISRPAIENDILYLRPEVLKLADGTTIKRGFPSGHGCSSYTLSKNGLFSRLGETTWWDVRNDKVNRFERVRTDCWISAIPAQGMLLSAEGGGGCSCGSWLETSIGFLPRKIDQALPTIPK